MIEFDNISLSFADKPVFNNLSLSINKGQKVLIFGKSGSGKTSLLNMLLGFTHPHQGKIRFNKNALTHKTIWDVRKNIAYIAQDTHPLGETVGEWFNAIACLKANHKTNFSEESMQEKFTFFHLENSIYQKDVRDLSGGEKQRIAIIAALCLGRDVFLLDEITASLDAELKAKTAEYFLSQKHFTILAISHDSVWKNDNRIKSFDIEKGQWL